MTLSLLEKRVAFGLGLVFVFYVGVFMGAAWPLF